jgi:hypothetical protein
VGYSGYKAVYYTELGDILMNSVAASVRIKLSLCLFKHNAMKTYGEVEI